MDKLRSRRYEHGSEADAWLGNPSRLNIDAKNQKSVRMFGWSNVDEGNQYTVRDKITGKKLDSLHD